jgi:hypothetical protein
MSPDTPAWWIPAFIAGAALLLFLVLRGRPRRREEEAPPPPPPPRGKRGHAPAEPPANGAGAERPPSTAVEHASGPLVATVDVIPGELRVDVFTHTLVAPDGPVACWSYVSDGLRKRGQKEIVFTVAQRRGEARGAYPRDLLQLYAVVHQLAGEGKLVDVGGTTTLGGTGLLGRKDFLGVVYTPPQVLPGVRVRAPSLLGLIVTAGEVAVAEQQGVVLLGKHYRYYPTAPWTDRDRAPLCSPEAMKDSLVGKAPRLFLFSASVRQEGEATAREEHEGPGGLVDETVTFGKQRIVLRLRPGAAEPLRKALTGRPADAPLALLTGPDPGAPACLAWEPGQKQPSAISKPNPTGVCIAGNFLLFLPQQEADGGTPFEDGFVMSLTDATWERVRAALTGGEPLSVPAAGDAKMGLEIVRLPALDPDYGDPVESHVTGGWGVFGGGMPSSAPVLMKSISLLTIVDVLERRVESAPLSTYIKAITAEVESGLKDATSGPGQDLALACEVRPDGGRTFDLSVRPGDADASVEGLRPRLMEIEPPPVVAPIRFQLNIQLRGGSGTTKAALLN